MADDAAGGASPKNEPTRVEVGEDDETRAARRELKQSSISDPSQDDATSGSDDKIPRPATPALNAAAAAADADTDTDMKDKVASPKKKRAHDQVEHDKETEETDSNSVASSDSAKDRALRLEPEKKRHRDKVSSTDEATKVEATTVITTTTTTTAAAQGTEVGVDSTAKPASSNTFAASAFGKLSSTPSPFSSLGGGSGFGSAAAAPKLSSFASSTSTSSPAPAAPPKLSFGGNTSASPFAGLSSGPNGLGDRLGGSTFGSALGSKPLGSFASGNKETPTSGKPPKPFGAPDSDVEESDGCDDDDEEDHPEDGERGASPEKETEDKKKLKLQRVEVNDGEAGEATVLSVRAKLFYHDKEAGWKERGAGMLKINVPQACVDFDDSGAPISGSFDASGLDTDEEEGSTGHKVARLIMRQDQTHRVILNTAILPAMKFTEKASLKSVGILFTAIEGAEAKPVSITMRMSAASAKSFTNEMSIVQRELQNN